MERGRGEGERTLSKIKDNSNKSFKSPEKIKSKKTFLSSTIPFSQTNNTPNEQHCPKCFS